MKRLWLVVLLAGCGGASEVDLDSATRAITAFGAGAQSRDVADSNPMPGQPPKGDPAATPAPPADPASSNPMPGAPAVTPLAPGSSNPMPGVVTTPTPTAAAFAVEQTR
jgi:hypothetical protein